MSSADRLAVSQTLDFKLALPKGTPGAKFCFAAVRREVLRQVRDSRWDLVRLVSLLVSLVGAH